jgi:hypothetical protein
MTLTATVTSIVDTPAGSVQFYNNGALFGAPQSLSNGQATYNTSALITGTHIITATYSGDTIYNASTSAMWIQAIYARPSIELGGFHTCGLKADGTLQCWGNNDYGQTAVPSPNANWVQVSAGWSYTCGLKGDGTLQCWGNNGNGQTTVPSPNANWVQVSAGTVHTCGLKADGTLQCWGNNDYGQTAVPSPNANWVQVSAGWSYTCGLKADGTLQCWGAGTTNPGTNPDYGQSIVPNPNANWVQVSAGGSHTCGLKADGTLQCWGYYYYGQTTVPSPNANWVQVSAGDQHTCGLKTDGTIRCWGYSGNGQTMVPSPNANWLQVSAGYNHTCGLKADGTIRCWGYNGYGQAPVITLTPSALANAMVGVAYTQNITGTGGTSPYLISVTTGLTLNNDGTWSGTPTTAGTFNFTAQAIDANNIAGTQNYALVVNKGNPTTTVTSSSNPSTYGQAVTITATVSPSGATGNVQFYKNGATFGLPVALLSGNATLITSTLSVGSHPITTTYTGDANYTASTSSTLNQVVNCLGSMTVTSNADSGTGSLRDAIANVCAGGTITFNSSLSGQTIRLASPLTLAQNVAIDGSSLASQVTISGDTNGDSTGDVRAFLVNAGIAATLNNLTIKNGSATSDGGGIVNNGTLTITSSSILTNTASSTGGAIANYGTLTVSNSTLAGNSAPQGSAIYNYGGSANLTVVNSTFSGNTVGQAIYANSANQTVMRNSIVANNPVDNCYGTITGTNNLANDGTCGSSFTNSSSIQLGALGNYGGGTQTIPLQFRSIAIDAADSNYCPSTDQRGQVRDDLRCDIGAYELKYSDTNVAILTPSTITMTTYGPVRIGVQDLGSTHPGVITATKVLSWDTPSQNALSSWWDITAAMSTGLNLTLKLCYATSELGTLNENDLRFWRYSNGTWSQVGNAPTFTGVSPNRCAEITGVTALSRWTLATQNPGGAPTAITMRAFNAAASSTAQVKVSWTTATELNMIGFNIWRSLTQGSGYQKINSSPVLCQIPGGLAGGTYSWTDDSVQKGTTYYYRLEVIEWSGKTELFGPISVKLGGVEVPMFLPMIRR